MITFYFTSKGIGGVQSLFFNLTKELYQRGIQVKFIYFRDTWLINELDKCNIEYKLFDLEKDNRILISEFINKDDIFVSPLGFYIIEEIYKIKPYFLFWTVHPDILSWMHSIKKVLIKEMIKQMIRRGGMYYMDKSCSDGVSKRFNLTTTSEYLPIPITGIATSNSSNLDSLIKKRNQDIISLSYIGRAEIWKINPVIKILSDLSGIRKLNKKIRLHIFTDDEEEFKKNLSNNSNEIEIIYHLNISGDLLDCFLKNEILTNFSMGTSCLESAKLGIPTILLDASYDPYPNDYKYNWIYNSEGFSLGKVIDKNYNSVSGYTLTEIFEQIFQDDSFICDVSNRCLEYTHQNHDIKTITSLFLEKTNLCRNKITLSIKHSLLDLVLTNKQQSYAGGMKEK
jgi:hypothetical protein